MTDETLAKLEDRCDDCDGKGFRIEASQRTRCISCDGSGYVPTQLGARILDLVRHNSRMEVSAELRVAGVAS